LTDTPDVPLVFIAAQLTPHKIGQHVHAFSAAHPVCHDAALPLRTIFAVHIRLVVHDTYIA